VKKGDTLAGIAAATLGDKNKWKLIVDANPGLDPRRLKVTARIRIPGQGRAGGGATGPVSGTPPVLPPRTFAEPRPNPADGPTEVQPAPAGSPGREVEVRAGDTLYEISRRELGDPNLYYKLIEANPGIDPKRLRKGMKIRLPAAQ
jgi:nucleoid-associated protein YgaU